jgi:hypothetical protein
MVIVQKPNPPLIVAALGWLIGFFGKGSAHQFGVTLFTVSIIIWAYLEITSGVNLFRRILGLVVLAMVSFSLYSQLH